MEEDVRWLTLDPATTGPLPRTSPESWADLAAQLASLKDEANAWLSDESYDALKHRLEDAHASVEAAAVEARRRVRLNEGRER